MEWEHLFLNRVDFGRVGLLVTFLRIWWALTDATKVYDVFQKLIKATLNNKAQGPWNEYKTKWKFRCWNLGPLPTYRKITAKHPQARSALFETATLSQPEITTAVMACWYHITVAMDTGYPSPVSVWPSRHDCLVQRLKTCLSAFSVGKAPLIVTPASQ